MKELSIEQKARAYDEAIERAKKLQKTCDSQAVVGWCEYIFPELCESEDERIIKEIISIVKSYRESCITEGNHRFDDCISWLEKQGEQKPTDEDVKEALRTEYEKGRADAFAQMQQEWSEEDEQIKERLIRLCTQFMIPDGVAITCEDWLKSIKDRVQPQNTWKPSDAQMVALKKAISQLDLGLSRVLNTLYNDLDKLTKE